MLNYQFIIKLPKVFVYFLKFPNLLNIENFIISIKRKKEKEADSHYVRWAELFNTHFQCGAGQLDPHFVGQVRGEPKRVRPTCIATPNIFPIQVSI